jgi:hypothetical protein
MPGPDLKGHWHNPRACYISAMGHEVNDEISLELQRQVAGRLRAQPGLLQIARDNLVRWSGRNPGAPGLLRCYQEWQTILERPLPDICGILEADTEDGRRLHQNSPFAGVLKPAEVWAIKSAIRQRHAKTAA